MNRRLLLIPTAKLLPVELQPDFGALPTGLVPLGSKTALEYIAEPYLEAGDDVLVASHDRFALIESFLSRHPGPAIRAIDVGDTRSLGETILTALRSLSVHPDQLVINYADTYIGSPLPDGNVIGYAEAPDLYRWTTFRLGDGLQLESITDKGRWKSPVQGQQIIVGVFAIRNVAAFSVTLDECLRQPVGDLDPFYEAIRQYFNNLGAQDKLFHPISDWRDFGHIDTYYSTQRKFFVKQRSFNSVQIDTSRGVVRKTSRHQRKLRSEIQWYLSLPSPLQHLAPRIFDHSLLESSTFVEMEFYGYPALNDVYLHGDWDPGIWALVLAAIETALRSMQAHTLTGAGIEARLTAMRQMYETKTIERLNAVSGEPPVRPFEREAVVINGRMSLGLPTVIDLLPDILSRAGIYTDSPFCIVHGDLCLSNILFDRRNGFVRLVDPRGEYGGFGIYGDPRYDLAKLSHSLQGQYDFIVNGLFQSSVQDGALAYHVLEDPRHVRLRPLFDEWLRGLCGPTYQQVKVIEGLLFLSMVALHTDRPAAQTVFIAKGLELLSGAALALGLAEPLAKHHAHA